MNNKLVTAMSVNNKFNAEKISLLNYNILSGQISAPKDFDIDKVSGHKVDYALNIGYNIEAKLAKADLTLDIFTQSNEQNTEQAKGNYHLQFIYQIDNIDELAKTDENNKLILNPDLANALSSVTYSTSRGILLTRLQGTPLQKFILPIINPKNLYKKNSIGK